VVVAEDELSVREGVCEILTREGFEVITSTDSGAEASDAITAGVPQLAVMGIDSAAFPRAWEAQSESIRSATALVALTSGDDVEATVRKAEDVGASALLARPVLRSEFAPAVHIALARFLYGPSNLAPQDREAS
jgi:AmiR/NasT family two-component response regulator